MARKSRYIVGGIHESNKCGKFEIVEYHNSHHVMVRFVETGAIVKTKTSHISQGYVRDPMSPTDYGFYIGTKYTSGKPCGGKGLSRPYSLWTGMQSRCFDDKVSTKSYKRNSVSICDEWKDYTNFYEWYIDQHGHDECGWDLDKDLLSGEIYSPETCLFLPKAINIAMQYMDHRVDGGRVGVRNNKSGYYIRFRMDNKEVSLGSYDTVEEASSAYKYAKAQWISTLANRYKSDLIDSTYNLLLRWHPDGFYDEPIPPY